MLAAGDTFRAAAVEQLKVWGERNGVPVVAQGQNADAASVAFDALQAAKARGIDVLIADTAGRLHTQHGLMAELGKIRRVLASSTPTAPHEVLMVIDGTTGQNALSASCASSSRGRRHRPGGDQARRQRQGRRGVRAGARVRHPDPLRRHRRTPEDLRVFDPEAFVDALLPESLGG